MGESIGTTIRERELIPERIPGGIPEKAPQPQEVPAAPVPEPEKVPA